jgi:hypothetical protein
MNIRNLLTNFLHSPGRVILAFGLIAVILPILLTQKFYGIFSFMETGPIGDTIGGITAPVIGLLNAVLLYVTLKRQDDQLAIQRADTEFDRRIDAIRSMIKLLKFNIVLNTPSGEATSFKHKFKGSRAIDAATNMFNQEAAVLQFYHIPKEEWDIFTRLLREIMHEAIFILHKNKGSKRGLTDKIEVYSYTTNIIGGVIDLFSHMESYYKAFPNDPGIDKFLIRDFAKAWPLYGAVKDLDPLK